MITYLRGIISESPPVKSANPSRTDPYFRLSYDPCNLELLKWKPQCNETAT